MSSRIRRAFVCVMGFTQTTRVSTGIEKLWCHLRDVSSADTLVVTPQTWDADARDLAALLDRHLAPAAEIVVAAYSWGTGQFFDGFSQALWDRGREIRHAVLCDGVYRSKLLPTWLPLNPKSLLPGPTIRVRPNVREVTWFYQRTDKPAGHEPLADDPRRTLVHKGIRLHGLRHDQMDDAPAFHHAVLRLAGIGPYA